MKNILKWLLNFLNSSYVAFELNRKIAKIYASLPEIKKIPGPNVRKNRNLWRRLGSTPNIKWYQVFYSINNIDSPEYITETDYYNKVEPTLNNRTFSEAFCDKNSYHKLTGNHELLPAVYVRNIQGVYYDQSYQLMDINPELSGIIPISAKKLVIKRSIDSGGGRDIEVFAYQEGCWQNNSGVILTTDYLSKAYHKNFIIQEYIRQHPFFSRFNATSVNTVRLFTYRSVKDNAIIPLQAVLRIGKPGAVVDNQAAGGVACGISRDGMLNDFAINKKGEKITSFNDVLFSGIGEIYKFQEMVATGKEIAGMLFYHRLLGFDFCVDENDNVKLIEINNRNNEINFYQMNNGPLFREYTEEVLDFCLKNRKTLCFDFEV